MLQPEPHWQWYQPFKFRELTPSILDWLLDPGSLTKRLKANSKTFRVQLLKQRWSQPFLSERKSLSLSSRQWANIREVKLICDGKPWIFARTVIPRSSLTGKNKILLSLGTKPLGQVLFSDPSTIRSPFEFSRITPKDYYYSLVSADFKKPHKQIWARRSIFYLSAKPLLVSEVFTPWFMKNNSI